jgi:hypothetical protein
VTVRELKPKGAAAKEMDELWRWVKEHLEVRVLEVLEV